MLNRDIIIETLHESIKPLQFINALWLEGSDATGLVDEYSDIDFWVDFEDEYEGQAIKAVEDTLSELAPIDFKYVMKHSHLKIRQRIYHLAGTSEYLMIDFCWQLSSRSRDEYAYYLGDKIEGAKVVFDKKKVIRYSAPLNPADLAVANQSILEDVKYRRSQHSRAEKYARRKQYLEAYAFYNRYVLEPLISILRLIYTPQHPEHYLIHISQHIPVTERERLEYFAQISSLEDIAERIPKAGEWFDLLLTML